MFSGRGGNKVAGLLRCFSGVVIRGLPIDRKYRVISSQTSGANHLLSPMGPRQFEIYRIGMMLLAAPRLATSGMTDTDNETPEARRGRSEQPRAHDEGADRGNGKVAQAIGKKGGLRVPGP